MENSDRLRGRVHVLQVVRFSNEFYPITHVTLSIEPQSEPTTFSFAPCARRLPSSLLTVQSKTTIGGQVLVCRQSTRSRHLCWPFDLAARAFDTDRKVVCKRRLITRECLWMKVAARSTTVRRQLRAQHLIHISRFDGSRTSMDNLFVTRNPSPTWTQIRILHNVTNSRTPQHRT